MPKTCRLCNDRLALNDDNWWRDSRYPDGWSTACKRCLRLRMRKRADAKMKTVHCVICNKLFDCYPDTARRYRLTCSRWHQRKLMSQHMLVRTGKRQHPWNFHPDGRAITPFDTPNETSSTRDESFPAVELDHPGLFDPFS